MKSKIYFLPALFIILPAVFLAGCTVPGDDVIPETFNILLWNVQNLFDGSDNGNEYADFREGGGWTWEKYEARITAFSRAILGMTENAPVPDLIGLVEIENLAVLDDLASALSKRSYNWLAFANIPGAPVGLGILSRHPLTDIRAHSITIDNETAPRPMLEVRVEISRQGENQTESLIFFLGHWKSKTGGDDATTALRRASARVVNRRYLEIMEEEPDASVIIMGDFNENHDEFHRRGVLSAILTDDPEALLLAKAGMQSGADYGFNHGLSPGFARDFLVLTGLKPPYGNFFSSENYFFAGTPVFFSPWFDYEAGSYFYRDNWETIDHFLLPYSFFTGTGWEYSDFNVLNTAPFTNSAGTPNVYNPRSGRGLSDHLPILLYLEYMPCSL